MVTEVKWYLLQRSYNFVFIETGINIEAAYGQSRYCFLSEAIERYKHDANFFLTFITDIQNFCGWYCSNWRTGRERLFK